MISQNSETVTTESQILGQRFYRIFLNLGLVGLLIAISVLVLDWLIYPHYLLSILSDDNSVFEYLMQLNFIHGLDNISTLLIGLGFTGLFLRHGRREGYLFGILFVFPMISYQAYNYEILHRFHLYELNSIDIVNSYLPVILIGFILSIILYKEMEVLPNRGVILRASIMLIITQVVPFMWYFISSPLRLVYDPDLGRSIGSFSNGLLIGVPHLIITVVSTVVFASLFVNELKSSKESLLSPIEETQTIPDQEEESAIVPLVDRTLTRYFIYVGVFGALITLSQYILNLVLLPTYLTVLFTDGLLPAIEYARILTLTYSFENTILLTVGLGFFSVFSKNGKKIGFIFLLVYFIPKWIFQESLGVFLISSLQIELSVGSHIGVYVPSIAISCVLAYCLMKNSKTATNKMVLGLASLMLIVSQIVPFVWFFFSQHLQIIYNFSQLTFEGTFLNAILYSIPFYVVGIISTLIYAALFILELRVEKEDLAEINHDLEVIEAEKEIVISK